MSSFIETNNGSFVASTDIVEVRKGGGKKTIVKTKHDEAYIIGVRAKELISKLEIESGPVIPAEAGYSVAFLCKEEGDEEWRVTLSPVVGWSRIETKERIYVFESLPVIAGRIEHYLAWALVYPDGKVTTLSYSEYPNVEQWAKERKAEQQVEEEQDDDDSGSNN